VTELLVTAYEVEPVHSVFRQRKITANFFLIGWIIATLRYRLDEFFFVSRMFAILWHKDAESFFVGQIFSILWHEHRRVLDGWSGVGYSMA
jgi:hypothetical protein